MRLLLVATLCLPTMTFAAGGGNDTTTSPPKTTNTTKKCKNAEVWDETLKKCVNAEGASLDDDTLYGAVRELAYAGRYEDAQTVLSVMSDQGEDRVLTYWGFTYRKMGDVALGMQYYRDALAKNPDNLLVRSYLGQGLVEAGNPAAALAQLREIQARGGAGSWPETSLRQALVSGQTYEY
jgi:tetratricopeptide (TPR) repeat protein